MNTRHEGPSQPFFIPKGQAGTERTLPQGLALPCFYPLRSMVVVLTPEPSSLLSQPCGLISYLEALCAIMLIISEDIVSF